MAGWAKSCFIKLFGKIQQIYFEDHFGLLRTMNFKWNDIQHHNRLFTTNSLNTLHRQWFKKPSIATDYNGGLEEYPRQISDCDTFLHVSWSSSGKMTIQPSRSVTRTAEKSGEHVDTKTVMWVSLIICLGEETMIYFLECLS